MPKLCLFFLSAAAMFATQLQPDARVTWGALDNGLTYAILPHQEPPERVSLRLYVRAGSLQEEEDQRGLAHFLEHMAFNGTTHFPANRMVEYFQRLGMSFGADTNAHTGFDETVYKLELPNADDALLQDAFKLLRDYADGMLLTEEEIEKERGVILSEKRTRDSVSYRSYIARMGFLYPESRIATRSPIGIESVIKEADKPTFESFYRRWYRPDRLAVVVVGNITPQAIEPLIKQHFTSLVAAETTAPNIDLGTLGPEVERAHVHTEMDAGGVDVSLTIRRPYQFVPDTPAKRLRGLELYVASTVINRRLSKRLESPDVPFISGRLYTYDWLDFVTVGTLTLSCEPENWQQTLTLAEQELRRVIQHGFNASELEEAKANVLRYFERQVSTRPTRKSKQLASDLVRALADRDVFTSPEDELAHAQRDLATMTPQSVIATFRAAWQDRKLQAFVTGKIKIEGDADAVLSVLQDSAAQPVAPLPEEEKQTFAYQHVGPTGTVQSTQKVEDLGITSIRFDNGVRLNFKQTDFAAETVSVLFRFGEGELSLPADNPGLKEMLQQAFKAGGLKAHSRTDLSRIFAGTTVGGSFAVHGDDYRLSANCKTTELRDQLAYLCAFLQHPGFREDARERAIRSYERSYEAQQKQADGIWQDQVTAYLANGDKRFGMPTPAQFAAVTTADMRQAMAEPLQSRPLEVTLVGDIPYEVALQAAADTVGALPERETAWHDYAERREVVFPAAGPLCTFHYETELEKAISLVIWPTDDIWDIRKTRRLGVLASVLSDRMRIEIREKQGASYSPRAFSSASDVFTGYGFVGAFVRCAPDTAEELNALLARLAADLAANGPTDDEVARALKPRLESLKQWVRNNSYWTNNVLASSGRHPQRFDWARSMQADIEGITNRELAALAESYLGSNQARRIIITPKPGEAEE